MTVNVPLLRKAVEWVESEMTRPEGQRDWDQGAWCGSRMCVAGFIAVTEGWEPVTDWGTTVERNGEQRQVNLVASEALGIDHDDASSLFIDTIDDTPAAEAKNVRRIAERIAGERL